MPMNTVTVSKPPIRVIRTDWDLLHTLANSISRADSLADDLLGELERAEIVPDTEKGKFIGIGSSAVYVTDKGKQEITLVLPGDADISQKLVSILTPIGVTLLGLSAGQSMSWQTRKGRTETLTITSVGDPSSFDASPNDDDPSAK